MYERMAHACIDNDGSSAGFSKIRHEHSGAEHKKDANGDDDEKELAHCCSVSSAVCRHAGALKQQCPVISRSRDKSW
jgi:hypothetical protein